MNKHAWKPILSLPDSGRVAKLRFGNSLTFPAVLAPGSLVFDGAKALEAVNELHAGVKTLFSRLLIHRRTAEN